MKTRLFRHGLAVGLLAAGCWLGEGIAAAADNAADDAALRRRIAGTWEGRVVSGDAAQPGAPRYTLRELVITPEKITAHDSDGRYLGTGTYKLAQTDGKFTIDATGTDGPSRGQTMLGIWKLEGDTLHWCSGNNGKPRPAEFRTRTSDAYLLILTRKKD